MNPTSRLEEIKKDLLAFFPSVNHHINNAIDAYKNSLNGLSYNQNTILDLMIAAQAIDSIPFDEMIRYMLNVEKPMERRLIVEREIKRLTKMVDWKINEIINDPIYKDRFHYIFGKKQRL